MSSTFIVDNVGGISGSLTQLIDGTSYLVAGEGISVVSQSNGSVKVGVTAISLTPMSQSFSGSASWTAPVTGFVTIAACGGGGYGNGSSNTQGGGGGGGAQRLDYVVPVMSGVAYSVSIGTGGSGGSNGGSGVAGGNGNDGTATTFGSLTFPGGQGGGGGLFANAPVASYVAPGGLPVAGGTQFAAAPGVDLSFKATCQGAGGGCQQLGGGANLTGDGASSLSGFPGGVGGGGNGGGGGGGGGFGHGADSLGGSPDANGGGGGSGGAHGFGASAGADGFLVVTWFA